MRNAEGMDSNQAQFAVNFTWRNGEEGRIKEWLVIKRSSLSAWKDGSGDRLTWFKPRFGAASPWTESLWTRFHIYLTGIVSISRCDLCKAFNMGTGTEESLCKWTLASSLKLPHKPGHKLRNGGRCQNTKNSPLTNTASSKASAFLPGKAPSDMGVYTDLAYYAWGICIF